MTDLNFAIMGESMVQNAFFGSYEILGLLIFLIFAFFLWKCRAPLSLSLMFGLGLSYTLMIMGIEIFQSIFYLGVIVLGVYLAFAILNFSRRQ